MYLSNALGVADNFDFEGLHNIIANIIQVVLVYAPVLSPHKFTKLKPYLPLEVDSIIHSKVRMSVIPCGIRLVPSPEIIRG